MIYSGAALQHVFVAATFKNLTYKTYLVLSVLMDPVITKSNAKKTRYLVHSIFGDYILQPGNSNDSLQYFATLDD